MKPWHVGTFCSWNIDRWELWFMKPWHMEAFGSFLTLTDGCFCRMYVLVYLFLTDNHTWYFLGQYPFLKDKIFSSKFSFLTGGGSHLMKALFHLNDFLSYSMSFINKYRIFLTLGSLEGMKIAFLLDKTVFLKDDTLGSQKFYRISFIKDGI